MSDPFTPIEKGKKKPAKSAQTAWRAIIPVPAGAGLPPDFLFKRNRPTGQWQYRDKDGKLLGFVYRYDGGKDGKSFRPCTYCENEAGERQWRMKGWDTPRPLYGLDRLAARPDSHVLICEGEKAADAAEQLLPDYVIVTSPNGSKSANKADWEPLKGRKVIIWPDADEPGQRYAFDVARALVKLDGKDVVCSIIEPPEGVPTGWDAADCLEQDGGQKLADQLLFKAVSAVEAMQKTHISTGSTPFNSVEPDKKGGGRKRPPARNTLVELADGCEFWHDPEKKAYATVPMGDHTEDMALDSSSFGLWLLHRDHEVGLYASEQVHKDTLRVLKAKAIFDGKCHQVFRRVGFGEDGRFYYDLGQSKWNAVAVGPEGWEVIDKAPIKFIRSSAMKALPIPEGGELIESLLRPFFNTESEDGFRLIVAWLVAAMFSTGPYPVLVFSGEPGAAKSTATAVCRRLIDPNIADHVGPPREQRDLISTASNSWVYAADNLSGIANWFSDDLCRLSTGGGFSSRLLHSNREEDVVMLERPVILNGIVDLATRSDLADRAITVSLSRIPDGQNKSPTEFWKEFDVASPFILGCLLDAVAGSLRNLSSVNLETAPRNIDFALRITAAESALGWSKGDFMKLYDRNRQEVFEIALESDPIGQLIHELITMDNYPAGWAGTAAGLLNLLNSRAPDSVKGRFWPSNPSAMGAALRRVSPVLRKVGFKIEKSRGTKRMISITPPAG
jgi:putative DNA primase/helicase